MTIQTDTPHPWDVAIAGAGPIGLLLAGELAERGIRVVVFERADSPSPIPKANGIVGHAAVELAERGILAGTDIAVVSPPRFQFGPLPLDLGVGPENPLHILPIPQRRLEVLLEARATRHGVRVLRGHEVLGFTQDDRGVTVEVRSGTTTTKATAAYLVGCDGAHSLVRKLAGIAFPGFTSDQIARIARVTIASDQLTRTNDGFDIPGVGRVAAMRPNQLPGGSFSIAPARVLDPTAPEDLYLISTHEPRGDAEPSDTVSIDDLRASLRRVLGAELPFTDATAMRSTVANSRQADSYRLGRIFLAGDAAHIFNAGGSALNVGLQDALDLAERLTAVLCDGAPVDELDAYEAVRRPAGERTLQQTRAQAALARDDESSRALRDIVAGLLADRPTARSLAQLLENA
jgi:2-polyprenyl-6-methoxyphenol hydroxylase-like FAD-dependent oxidoreductase